MYLPHTIVLSVTHKSFSSCDVVTSLPVKFFISIINSSTVIVLISCCLKHLLISFCGILYFLPNNVIIPFLSLQFTFYMIENCVLLQRKWMNSGNKKYNILKNPYSTRNIPLFTIFYRRILFQVTVKNILYSTKYSVFVRVIFFICFWHRDSVNISRNNTLIYLLI